MNIFIFRRDLRIFDNTSLNRLIQDAGQEDIALIFIYNKNQISPSNPYFSDKAFSFMNQALQNLNQQAHINMYESDEDVKVLQEIIKNNDIKRIYTNQDITQYAIDRDKKIKEFCQSKNIIFKSYNDYLLFNPEQFKTGANQPYKVFKPFYLKCLENIEKIHVNEFKTNQDFKVLKKNIFSSKIKPITFDIKVPATEQEVKKAIESMKNYNQTRNFLTDHATSKISASLKFGIISLRNAFKYSARLFGSNSGFIRQIFWKEFYHHHYVNNINWYKIRGKWPANIVKSYDKWKYENNQEYLEKWKTGTTGIDLIDAAMHELNSTGYMHNRMRMVVSAFLTKDLNIDWRLGERYFAQKLIDYDPIVNNQSWQWSAGCGLDFRGAWRVFAPEIQAQKFDKNNEYVKKHLGNRQKLKPIVDPKQTRLEFRKKYSEFKSN